MQPFEVARSRWVVAECGAFAPRLVVVIAVAKTAVDVERQLVAGPGVADPRRDVRLRSCVQAKAQEMVFLDVGTCDDVDYGFGLGRVFCRRVRDGLYMVYGTGWQCLQPGLQVLFAQLRRFVVNPYLYAAHAAQLQVALNVDCHAGRVLQRVLSGSALHRRVVGHIVYVLFAVGGVDGPFGGNGHSLKRFGWFCSLCRVDVLAHSGCRHCYQQW